MTNERAKEIMKCWYLNGTEGMTDERLGYIEGWFNRGDKLAFELAIKALEDAASKENTDVYSINNMSVSDIIHWCATHPDPEIKKQFEEELAKYNKMKENTNDRTETDPHH